MTHTPLYLRDDHRDASHVVQAQGARSFWPLMSKLEAGGGEVRKAQPQGCISETVKLSNCRPRLAKVHVPFTDLGASCWPSYAGYSRITVIGV
jgi:hypothetical protein